jgi:myo-inositol-1(or 4)-monophosphatase
VDDYTFAVQLSQEAGDYLARVFGANRLGTLLHTRLKTDRSLVTEADVAADQMIAGGIQRNFPGEPILSEELNPGLPVEAGGSGALWVVDPLDGTTNYSLGLPVWGVLIARLVDGMPEFAVLNFPRLGELYTARKGQGATLNGEPIHTRPPDSNRPLAFFTCCSRTHRRYKVSIPYKTRILGAAAYSFCSVATGMALVGFEAAPKIWDLTAGWLLVEEAGGAVEAFEGPAPFPVRGGLAYEHLEFPVLMAANQGALEKARQQIVPR